MMQVVNVKVKYLRSRGYASLEEWAKDPTHLYCGRDMSFYVKGAVGSKFKNPYPVGKRYTLDESLARFEEYARRNLVGDLHKLKGITELGCWCKGEREDDRCHCDILVKLYEQRERSKYRLDENGFAVVELVKKIEK